MCVRIPQTFVATRAVSALMPTLIARRSRLRTRCAVILFALALTLCMTELDIGEDADSWYTDVKLQLPASAPLTDVSHYTI